MQALAVLVSIVGSAISIGPSLIALAATMPSSIGFLHSPIPKPDFEYSQTVNNRESWRVADSQRPSSQGSTHRIIDPSQHNSHHKSHRESHHNHNHSSKHHGERHHRNSTLRYSKIVSTGRIEEYDILRDMGDGSFGSVVQAERKGTGEMVAIKKMKKTFNSWEDCLKLRELRVKFYFALRIYTDLLVPQVHTRSRVHYSIIRRIHFHKDKRAVLCL